MQSSSNSDEGKENSSSPSNHQANPEKNLLHLFPKDKSVEQILIDECDEGSEKSEFG
jgi:hypothetical protein